MTKTMMEELLKLSVDYSPPTCDLRCGRLCDDHGDERAAQLEIAHDHPEDVTDEEIEYYSDVFLFLSFNDLLFYSYPVIKHYKKNSSSNAFSFYLAAMNRDFKIILSYLTIEQKSILKRSLTKAWEWHEDSFDWKDKTEIQNFINLKRIGRDKFSLMK